MAEELLASMDPRIVYGSILGSWMPKRGGRKAAPTKKTLADWYADAEAPVVRSRVGSGASSFYIGDESHQAVDDLLEKTKAACIEARAVLALQQHEEKAAAALDLDAQEEQAAAAQAAAQGLSECLAFLESQLQGLHEDVRSCVVADDSLAKKISASRSRSMSTTDPVSDEDDGHHSCSSTDEE